jgi:putative transposase
MYFDSAKHQRRSIRLKNYDYSQSGAYFVTICTLNRSSQFGPVVDGAVRLNDAGRVVQAIWDDLPKHCPGLELDAFVLMPNHVHGIVVIASEPLLEVNSSSARSTLSKVVGRFKMTSAKEINFLRNTPGLPVWQRSYYEHVIRDEASLNRIREYIANNPFHWDEDQENPDRR